jgi:hypothetical protein
MDLDSLDYFDLQRHQVEEEYTPKPNHIEPLQMRLALQLSGEISWLLRYFLGIISTTILLEWVGCTSGSAIVNSWPKQLYLSTILATNSTNAPLPRHLIRFYLH